MGKRREPEISEQALCAEYEALYHYALSLCRDRDQAQDVAQETFLRAMRAAGRFRGEGSLYTWLCAIAGNVWRDRLKKQGREAPLPEDMALPEPGPSPEQRAETRDVSLAVHRALHALAEPYKEVFSLRVFGELSFREIGELFGKTEGWARVAYHRARKAIIETLRKDGTI